MFFRLLFLVWFASILNFQAFAEEFDPQYSYKDSIIFVGELAKTILVPDRSPPAHWESCTNDGVEEECLVFSRKGCGWETIEFEVLQNLWGPEASKNLTLSTYLNSWCKSSVEITLREIFVMALKRKVPLYPEFGDEYFIRTFQIMRIDDLKRVIYIDSPHLLYVCSKILGIDCWASLRTIEPWKLDDQEPDAKWWNKFYEDYLEKDILIKGDNGEVYLTQVLDVDDLIKRLEN